ncbi:tetratricopeptide repeat protein [Haliangium sp.]|uniref:tetratricopeptide repeat protein n=1 Tax=Haliangium sp. TaxID=2663208 RepID=UPI003D12676F
MPDSDTHADPSNPFAQHLDSGAELLRRNRNEEARKAFLAALEAKPDDLKALALLGLSCFRMGDFQSALPIYQRLVQADEHDASHWLNLGLVHLKLGDADAAIRELRRSRELDPTQVRAVSYLGLAYARTGAYANAYQAFLQAGDAELAKEMEQYLDEGERARIQAAVPDLATPTLASSYDDGELDDADIEILDIGDGAEVAADGGDRTEPMDVPLEPVPRPGDDARPRGRGRPGAITEAVDLALPSAVAAAGAARVAVGHVPPMPLSEFATARLIRPDDGEHAFERSAGGVLVVHVRGRIFTRTEGVNVTGGSLTYEVASRHVRGSSTGETFSRDGRELFIVSGDGHLIASPLGETFSVVALDDDILYLREDLVFAFEEQLRWENGHVPGSRASINMVQFRGQGEVAFRSRRPLLSIKLAQERVLFVDAQALCGWIGRVVPRAVKPGAGDEASALFVECTGEGVVLIEEEEEQAGDWARTGMTGVPGGAAEAEQG